MGALAERSRGNLSLSWRWFGHWRRRYMWLRLLILLAVFAQPIYEIRKPRIRDLVIIAIKGIESAKGGPYFETRVIQFQEKKQLQRSLLAYFDRNEDGRLDRAESQRLTKKTGLTRGQVAGSGLRVELDPLVEASHRVGLLSRTKTANDIRREALAKALATAEQEHEALWREAGPDLAMQYPTAGDYLKWETWARGLDAARGQIVSHLGMTVASSFAGLVPPGYAQMRGEPRRKSWGGAGWLILGLVAVLCIHRYGKGKELERRFQEDAALAAAPCPVCGEPTNDYGALAEHRAPRAWAMAAVAGLAVVSMSALRWPEALRGVLFQTHLHGGSDLLQVLTRIYSGSVCRAMEGSWVAIAVVAAAFGVVRWILWPREIHAVHRRPCLLAAGFGAGVVLVVALLSGIVALGMQAVETPRARAIMMVSSRQAERRASGERSRRGSRDRGRHMPHGDERRGR
ncbi:MAG: hypothetical protein MUQ65_09620 [Armatimonadetes bacterium]|nr:hypothetical protein [Armatimonadota bacterium]